MRILEIPNVGAIDLDQVMFVSKSNYNDDPEFSDYYVYLSHHTISVMEGQMPREAFIVQWMET